MTAEHKILEKAAMALCAARHGPLENGSWAKLGEDARERLRFEARAVLAAARRSEVHDGAAGLV